MDESWRMRMGMPNLTGRRRASENLTSSGRSSGLRGGSESGAMDAEDFNDVFGGPPRSVLNRKLSCDFTSYDYFYKEIFRRREDEADRSKRSGRRLQEFRIPASRATEEKAGFYSDMFGSPSNSKAADDDHREKKSRSSSSKLWRSMSMSKWTSKSKSKSKSNSSSVLSYEEIKPPIRSGIEEEDDVALASYAAKLRPINVPCRWNSPTTAMGEKPFQYPHTSYTIDNYYPPNEYNDVHFTRSSNPSFSHQVPSPKTEIPYSTTMGIPVEEDASELESPSSANSTLYHHYPESSKAKFQFNPSYEPREVDEFVSSYVIEVDSRGRGVSNEAADIDDAIAWAKGKYQGCSSSSGELNARQHESNYQFGGFEGL